LVIYYWIAMYGQSFNINGYSLCEAPHWAIRLLLVARFECGDEVGKFIITVEGQRHEMIVCQFFRAKFVTTKQTSG